MGYGGWKGWLGCSWPKHSVTHGIATIAHRRVSLCGVGELYGPSSIVPDFSMRTSLAYVWKEEAWAPLIAPLEGAQHVSKCAALGHPWYCNMGAPARVAVRCGASCTANVVVFAFVLNFSMRTSLACVWKDEAQAPLIAPLEGAQLVSKCCI